MGSFNQAVGLRGGVPLVVLVCDGRVFSRVVRTRRGIF